MRGQPGHNAQPHARLQPIFQGIDAWITSELNEASVCKLRVSLMSLTDIFDIPFMGVLYNQALADVRSTGAGIKCLYFILHCLYRYWKGSYLQERFTR